jgi:hypothetical protein
LLGGLILPDNWDKAIQTIEAAPRRLEIVIGQLLLLVVVIVQLLDQVVLYSHGDPAVEVNWAEVIVLQDPVQLMWDRAAGQPLAQEMIIPVDY